MLRLLLFILFPCLLFANDQSDLANYKFKFPRDHGSHDNYLTEWWHFVGHLKDDQNDRTFGFQLTFFRINAAKVLPESAKFKQVYIAHFAITDDQANKYYVNRKNMGGLGSAGSSSENLFVQIDDWYATQENKEVTLRAIADAFEIKLNLTAKKPLVLQGKNGYSKKGPQEGNESLYMSFPLLEGSGKVRVGRKVFKVQAQAWMDHEVVASHSPFSTNHWDWFAIQLNDNHQIMLYQIRHNGKLSKEYSHAIVIDPENKITQLDYSDYSIKSLEEWKSPVSSNVYPSGWEIKIPDFDYKLKLMPSVKEQEIYVDKLGRGYWEGRNKVLCDDQECGNAYVELLGYDENNKFNVNLLKEFVKIINNFKQ